MSENCRQIKHRVTYITDIENDLSAEVSHLLSIPAFGRSEGDGIDWLIEGDLEPDRYRSKKKMEGN